MSVLVLRRRRRRRASHGLPDGTSSCVYDAGSPPVSRLEDLGGAGLHQLTAAQMTDGPVCGAGSNAVRWRSAPDPAGARHAAPRGRRRRRPRGRCVVPAAGTIVERVQSRARLRDDVRRGAAQHGAGGLRRDERLERTMSSKHSQAVRTRTRRRRPDRLAHGAPHRRHRRGARRAHHDETLIGASYRHGQEASYGAEAALERALHDLATMPDWSPALAAPPGNVTSGFDDGRRCRARPTGARWTSCGSPPSGSARATCATVRSIFGADSPQWRLFAHALGAHASARRGAPGLNLPLYLVVWVADDESDGDGDPAVDSNAGSSSARWRSGPVGPGGRSKPASGGPTMAISSAVRGGRG